MLILASDTNRVKAVRQFVQTFCIFAFQNVTPRELDLLCEIIYCGEVGEKAKKNFIMNYSTTKDNYAQIVKRLADKGILKDKETRSGKKLHEEFKNLSEMYINSQPNGNRKVMLLEWKV